MVVSKGRGTNYSREDYWLTTNAKRLQGGREVWPFTLIVCERGQCDQCQIYLDWQKLGEVIFICAWCSKVIDRKPDLGPVVSHGICPECKQKYFPGPEAGQIERGSQNDSR